MKAEILSQFPMPWLTCIALLIFFSVFCAMFVRTFLKSNKDTYKKLQSLPLSDEKGAQYE